jgi:glycerol-3-phosphate acyltransferase PlsY
MDLFIALLAALAGYLLGSISFARVIVRLVAPDQEITGIKMNLQGTQETVELAAIAGTTVAAMLGDKWGGITALLDILKAVIPTLVFRLLYPDQIYHLLAATTALVGHNWPVYHRFKGGRGLSPMLGGFLVVDWLGALITNLIALVLGLARKSIALAYLGGTWLMIPWLWIRTRGDPAHVIYVIGVNLIMVLAMTREIRAKIDRRRRGISLDYKQGMAATPMGRGIKRIAKSFGMAEDET